MGELARLKLEAAAKQEREDAERRAADQAAAQAAAAAAETERKAKLVQEAEARERQRAEEERKREADRIAAKDFARCNIFSPGPHRRGSLTNGQAAALDAQYKEDRKDLDNLRQRGLVTQAIKRS